MKKVKLSAVLVLICSTALLAQQAANAPVGVKPPVEWLQKYAMYLSTNAEALALQTRAQNLVRELSLEMDSKGYTLDTATVMWVPKPAPAAKE